MSARERTVQQRDPLAALIGRPTSYLAAIVTPLYATYMTWVNRDGITSLPLAVVAVLIVVAGGVVLWEASGPLRAPLSARTHALIVGLALTALVVSSLSMWGSDAFIRDDWGAPVTGLFILALAPYRPAKELVTSGALSAILAAFVALVQAGSFVTVVPVGAFIVVAITPILALSLAAAAFTDVLVRSLDRWRARALDVFNAMSDERGESIARSVQQNNVTILNQEVVPFFTTLLAGEPVDESTRQRAREIANAVRAVMVAEVDRTWLESVVEQAGARVGRVRDAASTVLRDEHRLAEHMSTDERTAMRAFVVALLSNHSVAGATIKITKRAKRCDVRVTAPLIAGENAVRAELAPFLAVVRVMFSDLQVDHDQPHLTLRFSYEQR